MKKRILILAIIFFVIDILLKLLIDFNMSLDKSIILIPHFFNLTKVYNYGASWSFLSGYNILLIIITIIMLIILYNYQKRFKENIRNTIAFSLLYGGIWGNLLNRLVYGYVIDFLDFKIFGYDFPIFNFADIWIVLGILLLFIAILKKEDEI